MPNDTLPLEARENTLKKVSEILSRFREKGVPLLDPEDDINVCYSQRSYMLHIFSFSFTTKYLTLFFVIIKIKSSSYRKAARRLEALENLFDRHEIARTPLIEQKLKVFHMKQDLNSRIKLIKKTMRSSTALAFKDELKARKRVLRRLG